MFLLLVSGNKTVGMLMETQLDSFFMTAAYSGYSQSK